MLLMLAVAAVAGCTAHARVSVAVAPPAASSVLLGIAGSPEHETTLLVPSTSRASPYYWDRVPAADTPLQVLRACSYYTVVLRVAPVTADRWWCWDQEQRHLTTFADAPRLEAVAAQHPEWIWIIGNEPDAADQDDMSPRAYAEFFGDVAMTVTKALRARDSNAVPRLVFCQVSLPTRKGRCEQAYVFLKQLIAKGHWPGWPSDVSAADVIHAISVHSYARSDPDCGKGHLCLGAWLEEGMLGETMTAWRYGLDEFVRWARSVDGGALATKPLWLTEFGVLAAFCPRALEVRPGTDRSGGVRCPDMAQRDNGRVEDDHVYYGRNENEGIWGVQHITLRYLVNPDRASNGNRGDWAAAWWFGGQLPWYGKGECRMTGWLLGDDVDCGRSLYRTSRAGHTFRATIQCLVHGRDCLPRSDNEPITPQGP